MRLLLVLVFLVIPYSAFAAGNSHSSSQQFQPPAQQQPAFDPGMFANPTGGTGDDGMMQMAMQAVMASISPDQLAKLAACMEKYVDPQTANAYAAQAKPASPGAAMPMPSTGMAQQFMASPQGQLAMQNCQNEIQALLPAAQQKFQQDLSQNPALSAPKSR